MLTEAEVRKRAHDCCAIHFLLSWLSESKEIRPKDYWAAVEQSSLELAENDFLCVHLSTPGRARVGLDYVQAFYNATLQAFCEVLGIDSRDPASQLLTEDEMKRLGSEVGFSF